MEIKRVIDVFEILSENLLFNIDDDFMFRLCKNLNSISIEDKNFFSLSIFLHSTLVNLSFLFNIKATIPVTIGVAMEVPLFTT